MAQMHRRLKKKRQKYFFVLIILANVDVASVSPSARCSLDAGGDRASRQKGVTGLGKGHRCPGWSRGTALAMLEGFGGAREALGPAVQRASLQNGAGGSPGSGGEVGERCTLNIF